MPNNRQWADLALIALVVVFSLCRSDLRSSIRSLLRALLDPKLFAGIVLMTSWVTGEVLLARHFSMWNVTLATSTGFWFVASGFVLYLNTSKQAAQRHFFLKNGFAAMKWAVFLDVFMNLFVLSFRVELVLQAVILFFVLISVVASRIEEYRLVKKLADVLLGACAIALVGHEILVVATRQTLDLFGMAREFALPVWLALGLLPFVYIVGVASEYELAFFRIEWGTGPSWGRREVVRDLVEL